MITEFADWYSAVDVASQSGTIEKRQQAIEKLCKSASPEFHRDMIMTAFELGSDSEDLPEAFVQAFRETDASFRTVNNGFEHSLLAGAILANLLETGDLHARQLLALMVTCVSLQGVRNSRATETISLFERADNLLMEQSAAVRQKPSGSMPSVAAMNAKKIVGDVEEHLKQNQIPQAIQQITPFLETAAKNINTLSKVLSQAKACQKIYEEELNILWWLIGGHSRGRNCRFCDLNVNEIPLVAGKELADLTQDLPGPYAVRAFIEQAVVAVDGRISQTVTIEAAVNATDSDWRKQIADEAGLNGFEHCCPIHISLIEASKSSSWKEAFFNGTSIKSSLKIGPIDLGLQMYRENLLLHFA